RRLTTPGPGTERIGMRLSLLAQENDSCMRWPTMRPERELSYMGAETNRAVSMTPGNGMGKTGSKKTGARVRQQGKLAYCRASAGFLPPAPRFRALLVPYEGLLFALKICSGPGIPGQLVFIFFVISAPMTE